MKKKLLKPGFEVIFSLSLAAILCLPPLVMAQSEKNFQAEIVNGDTTINGKDIKKLSADERRDALKELNKTGDFTYKRDGKNGRNRIVIKKRKGNGNKQDVFIERDMMFDGDVITAPFNADVMIRDSANKIVKLRRLMKLNDADTAFAFNYKFDDETPMRLNLDRNFSFSRPDIRPLRMSFNNRNTQHFNYTNTDDDGISTRVSFSVSDASKEKVKSIAGADKANLGLNDLNLSPEFSTGKTLISFNLAAKTTADVKLTGNDGKVIWNDKAVSGSFSKKISLPVNGIYYLSVKQGAGTAVKKIVKED